MEMIEFKVVGIEKEASCWLVHLSNSTLRSEELCNAYIRVSLEEGSLEPFKWGSKFVLLPAQAQGTMIPRTMPETQIESSLRIAEEKL
jgi:hypothetical protein